MRIGLKSSLLRIKPSLPGRLFLFSVLMAAALFLPDSLPAHLASPYEERALSVFSLAPPLLQLPEVQISLLFSENTQMRQEALDITARNVADYLRPKAQAGQWQAVAARLPAEEGAGQAAVALALSCPPEEGILCLLTPGTRGYTLVYAQEGFLPLEDLRLWPGETGAGSDPSWFLAVTENHDESLGAYSRVRRFSLWFWSGEKLAKAFEANLSWQIAFPRDQSWIGADQQMEVGGGGERLSLTCRQSYCQSGQYSAALLSPADWEQAADLEVLAGLNRSYREEYHYEPEYQFFGLTTGRWLPEGQSSSLPVLVVRDMSLDLEGPFAAREEYLLKTAEGLLTTAPKTEVTLPD